ncbi:MAG: ATP-dependent Clp protease adaptor ClpS [Flavobacteriales bacterium]|nr:ATP-dependent Clp protease adaptor ClpS [Flavobacteriales bacterium]
MTNSIDWQEEVLLETEELTDAGRTLMLYNDEVNSFDHVIDCLIEVCQHDLIQAEQITHIVHFNGKCDAKRGSEDKLLPMCSELLRRGLTAEVI